MWDQIFFIGFKSELWLGQNMSLMDFFLFLKVFAMWAGELSSLKNNIWLFLFRKHLFNYGKPAILNIFLYSKALIDFSQWSSSPVPAAEKAPHTMTPLPPCLTVVDMLSLLYFSPELWTHLSRATAWNWILDSSLQVCWTTLNQTFHILAKTQFSVWCFSETAVAF